MNPLPSGTVLAGLYGEFHGFLGPPGGGGRVVGGSDLLIIFVKLVLAWLLETFWLLIWLEPASKPKLT